MTPLQPVEPRRSPTWAGLLVIALGSQSGCPDKPGRVAPVPGREPGVVRKAMPPARATRAVTPRPTPRCKLIPCQLPPRLVKAAAVCEERKFHQTGNVHHQSWSCRIGRFWLRQYALYGFAWWILPNKQYCGDGPGAPYDLVLRVHRDEARGIYHFVCDKSEARAYWRRQGRPPRTPMPDTCFAVQFLSNGRVGEPCQPD